MMDKKSYGGFIKILLFTCVAITVLFVGRALDVSTRLQEALIWLDQLGWTGIMIFTLLYILACVFFFPGSILTVGAGVLFGVVKGFIIVSVASTLGATAAFLVGRYFAREWVSGKTAGSSKFTAIDDAIAQEGGKIVFLMRLSPVFPFNLLNYACGLTRIPLRHYMIASWIGMMPGTLMYVYMGFLAGNIAALGSDTSSGIRTPMQWFFYAIGLLATIILTFYITRIARKALYQKIENKGTER